MSKASKSRLPGKCTGCFPLRELRAIYQSKQHLWEDGLFYVRQGIVIKEGTSKVDKMRKYAVYH